MTLEQVLHIELTASGYFTPAFYGDGQLLSTANALNKNEAKTKAAAVALKYVLFSISQVCTFTSAQQLFVQLRLLYFDDGLGYAEVLVANYRGGKS